MQQDHPCHVVIGGGLTGISTALHLQQAGEPWRLLERDDRLGGLARSETRDGFTFDHTGHWLHLRDPAIRELVTGLLGDQLVEVARVARIWSHGRLTLYPFQANLHGLPPEVIHECLIGLIRARMERGDAAPRNFEEYILHHFGAGIARHFMVPYNTKLWGVHPREITSAWCSRFVPIPDLDQVVAGAVGAGPAVMGYNVRFLYPRQGGIETLSRALAGELDPARVRTGVAVDRVDPVRRVVRCAGEELPYRTLMSSMPLTHLVRALLDPPAAVVDAASRLRATSVRYLNVGTRTPAPVDYHWVYVPEERYPFYRVGVFSNAVASMAPPGCASYYVELSERAAPADPRAERREVLAALAHMGAITSPDDVVVADFREIPIAYVVFDEHYEDALGVILPYLSAHGILSRGRYGAWIYNAMEDSLIAGREAAALMARCAGRSGERGEAE